MRLRHAVVLGIGLVCIAFFIVTMSLLLARAGEELLVRRNGVHAPTRPPN
jgi:hypothetical protein